MDLLDELSVRPDVSLDIVEGVLTAEIRSSTFLPSSLKPSASGNLSHPGTTVSVAIVRMHNTATAAWKSHDPDGGRWAVGASCVAHWTLCILYLRSSVQRPSPF